MSSNRNANVSKRQALDFAKRAGARQTQAARVLVHLLTTTDGQKLRISASEMRAADPTKLRISEDVFGGLELTLVVE